MEQRKDRDMKINWKTYEDGRRVGYTTDGVRFSTHGDSIHCTLYGGGFGYGDTVKEAYDMAKADRKRLDDAKDKTRKANLKVD